MYCIYVLQYCTLGGYWKFYISKQEICIVFMYCNTVILEAIANFILANKRYVLHLCTAILSSWRLLKYYGGHHLPNNNVNTVTLFLMYRVIHISCLLRAILAELQSEVEENYGHHNISLASKSTVLQYINSIHISCLLVWNFQ